jgi:hypothetical protein
VSPAVHLSDVEDRGVYEPGREILIARSTDDALGMTPTTPARRTPPRHERTLGAHSRPSAAELEQALTRSRPAPCSVEPS